MHTNVHPALSGSVTAIKYYYCNKFVQIFRCTFFAVLFMTKNYKNLMSISTNGGKLLTLTFEQSMNLRNAIFIFDFLPYFLPTSLSANRLQELIPNYYLQLKPSDEWHLYLNISGPAVSNEQKKGYKVLCVCICNCLRVSVCLCMLACMFTHVTNILE